MADRQRKQIVVVEDEEKIAAVLKHHLESAGYDVHTETTARGALTYLASHQPHLVTLDLRLPDASGYEVSKEVRRLYPSWAVPIVMITAMDRPIDQLRGYCFGADAYLAKPLVLIDLVNTVAQLLTEPSAA